MGFIIFIICVVLIVRYFMNAGESYTSGSSVRAASPSLDDTVQILADYYDLVRGKKDELGAGFVAVATYFREIDGKVDNFSPYMSVITKDVKNVELARALGFQANVRGGETYYEYVLDGKFSRDAKYQVIRKLAPIIESKYPDDVVEIDKVDPMLTSMFDYRQLKEVLDQYIRFKR